MEALTAILIDTYNPNPSLRQAAEKALQQFLATPGSLTILINTIGTVTIHVDIRKATALIIKNRLRDYWSTEEKALPSSEEEKAYFKHQVMVILLAEHDNSIRGILAESVRIASEFEFPQKWPELIPTIITSIQSSDVLRIYNALLALRKLVKRYEYKDDEARQPLNDILQALFPFLQELMKQILSNNSIEAAQVMRLCLKIFWSATNYTLPLVQGVDVSLWFTIIGEIMAKRLPEASEGIEPLGQPTAPEERKQWPWWKLKKWAARIMTHFIQRYGNPRYAPEPTKAFSEYFRSHIAVALMMPAFHNLEWLVKGYYLTEHVHRACISYLANCAEMSPTYKVLKPHLEFLLFHVIFPTLCVTVEDVRLFDEDPVEFVRKLHDPLGDWLSPSVAAINLLQMLARYRQKDTLPIFLPFLQSVLAEYDNAPPELKDYRKKDGCMVAMAALSKIMSDNKTYAPHLFPFLMTHVLPEFKSPVGYLRARACWTIEYFSDLNWHDQTIEEADGKKSATKKGKGKKVAKGKDKKLLMTTGQLLSSVLQYILAGLRDPALPVQAASACSLRSLIGVEEAKELLRPVLKDIIVEYFRIMEEVENESVLAGLQTIVTEFGDAVADIAPTMAAHLVRSFNEYAAESGDDEEAAFNAIHCLDTIDALIEAVQDHDNVINEIEPILHPLFISVLQSSGDAFEYIDTIIHMISGFTYFATTITPTMWALCGPIVHTLNSWAIDYICEMMSPILNYMTKGMDTFLKLSYNDKPVVLILLEAVGKAFDNDEGHNGHDASAAATLLTCIFTSCKDQCPGQVHSLLPQIIAMVYARSLTGKNLSVKLRLLEVILSAIYYDAAATLTILAQPPVALLTSFYPSADLSELAKNQQTLSDYFFSWLYGQLKDMERDFSQRLVVLAFTALFALPSDQLPPILATNMQAMFQQMIRELMLYVPDGGYDEDEDCLNAEDEDYREMLENLDKEERVKRELYIAGEAVDDEDDEEAYSFTSPIEHMDMTGYFFQSMEVFMHKEPTLFASLRAGLSAEDQQRLDDLYKHAQQKKAQQQS
eukprot:gene4922-5403_t